MDFLENPQFAEESRGMRKEAWEVDGPGDLGLRNRKERYLEAWWSRCPKTCWKHLKMLDKTETFFKNALMSWLGRNKYSKAKHVLQTRMQRARGTHWLLPFKRLGGRSGTMSSKVSGCWGWGRQAVNALLLNTDGNVVGSPAWITVLGDGGVGRTKHIQRLEGEGSGERKRKRWREKKAKS